MSDTLIQELKELIFTACNVVDVEREDLGPDDPLTGPDSPLGLDSIDAVELVVEVQKRYNVRIDSRERSREVLGSLNILADFLRRQGAA
jgi:acyl carrier protein